MVVQSDYLVHLFFIVRVDSQVARDLAEGEHVGSWGELEVHYVAVQVDVGWLVRQRLSACYEALLAHCLRSQLESSV